MIVNGNASARLIVSIVVHHSPLPALERTLDHLHQAGVRARAAGLIREMPVTVLDNGSGPDYGAELCRRVRRCRAAGLNLSLIRRTDNVGYGRGHNEVDTSPGDFRLILNPDVFLEPDALVHGLGFLLRHCRAGLVVPWVVDGQGRPAYLCKRYPSVLVLGLRGFSPAWLRKQMAGRLARYEIRDLDWDRCRWNPGLVSGCCLLMRGEVWRRTAGFCPEYFMYFEDFDFSLRAGKFSQIAYVPEFRVTHLGGMAARKGWRHRYWFMRSAWRFFNRYGWRWI